jgi:methionyl-tRNA synthetase
MSKRYTITAALPYTNGPIHIGHLAGVYVPADIYARFLRLQGADVLFVCGSDEHGVPITIKAKKEGVSPQAVVDKYHKIIKESFIDFGISFDNYSRTSSEIHHKTASDFFKVLNKKKVFIEQTTAQLYDGVAQQFLADRFVIGICPKCGYNESYGDQCESCGTSHNATDLIQPKSMLSGSVPELKQTKHWFLPLDKYESFLREWILEGHKSDWKSNVYGQCKSWLEDGLRPRAVTRDLDWGIPVPVKDASGKVLYVWFDAPIGYISATKEWAKRTSNDWEPYWKSEDTTLVHFIGKDNIVFHCIIFPAMLKAERSYILPQNVPANEFLNLEGQKLSTSKNWAVWLHEFLEDFPEKQDVLRYVLTANAPETKDNDFTWRDFQARNNNELVAIFGNFINRVLVLTKKYYDSIVPHPHTFSDADQAALSSMREYPSRIAKSISRYRFREASQELMNLARLGNKYLADAEPWKVIKYDEERVKTILYVALQITQALATLSAPFLPFTSKKLSAMLQYPVSKWDYISEETFLLPSGHQIGAASLLFTKIEDVEIAAQLDKLKQRKELNEKALEVQPPIKDTIAFDQFEKLDLRVGTIISAKKIPKTKKLMLLEVDTGTEVRNIVSGIAADYESNQLLGKQVTVLLNLAPRTLKGVESQGMILMTESSSGKKIFIQPDASETSATGLKIS